jgi:hypothetical protein
MACSCKNKDKSGHSISPYDFCNYCAEKHLSSAFGSYNEHGFEFPYRQIEIGELKLFEMHQNKDNDLTIKIRKLRELISNREQFDKNLFERLVLEFENYIDAEVQKEKKTDILTSEKRNPEKYDSVYETDIIGAELDFCTAWTLFNECGYYGINRTTITDKITLSQIKCYKIDRKLAEDMRDIRHLIQYRKENTIGDRWINVARKFNERIVPNT